MRWDNRLWTPLVSPIFILSPIRSGSTLLRCILNSHSLVYAPHELHFRYLEVNSTSEYLDLSLDTLNVDPGQLRFLLWDRLYHSLLLKSGKRMLVDKSPSNVLIWRDLQDAWPDARFILLRRDPAAIARSIVDARDGRNEADAVNLICSYVSEMEKAKESISRQFSLSYEEVVIEPERTLSALCDALGIPFETAMLDYGKHGHGPFVYGIGDWSDSIKIGAIQPPNLTRLSVTDWPQLSHVCKLWGYQP